MFEQRHIHSLVTAGIALFTPAGIEGNAAESHHRNQPNIVFILADDWGWGDLSCHGHPWLKTPNIDRLAQEGTEFLQFNVSNPVCSPSRVAFMTGMYPARFCIHQHFNNAQHHIRCGMPDWLDPNAPMLPRILKQAGYKTGHFGKWHLTNMPIHGAPRPEQYGIDEYEVHCGGGDWPPSSRAQGLHRYMDKVVDFIRRHRNQPFFLNVWIHESHTPHDPTPES
ncbi:MAG: N-acetylgalactosamine-6-sulfatase, partial [Lentisphaerae bacterium]